MNIDQPVSAIPAGYEPAGPVRYVPYEHLLKLGRAVKTRGRDVLYQYAGENPQKRFATFGTRKIARMIAGDLLAALRKARTDSAYNRVLDEFRGEIRASQEIERVEQSGELVEIACPGCGTMLQLAPVFVDRAHDLCPKCNAAPVADEEVDVRAGEVVVLHKGRSAGATSIISTAARVVPPEEIPTFTAMFAADPHGYEKRVYEVLQEIRGQWVAISCWPNAEQMHSIDGGDWRWPTADVLCKPKEGGAEL